MRAKFTILTICLFSLSFAWAQKQSPLDVALRYVEQNYEQWGLQEADIADVVVSDQYDSKHNGVTHIYFKQRYASIEVYNAINGIHIAQNGTVAYATNRFLPDLKDRVNTTVATVTAQQAIDAAAETLGLQTGLPLRLIEQPNAFEYIFEGGNLSNSNIHVKLAYQPLENGAIHLVWDFAFDMLKTPDYWSLRVDATDGSLLNKHNYTLFCNFNAKTSSGHTHAHSCGLPEAPEFTPVAEALTTTTVTDGATYNVYAIPTESPNFGDRQLTFEPSDPVASPYGWHDTNGAEGAEFTITRGNNVHAFQSRNDNGTSLGDEPDGGNDLFFDFPIDPTQEPDTYSDAAVTQLFYMVNIMHDFAYHYGLDEEAGNFQQTNYTSQGNGNDAVRGLAQNGADLAEPSLNNASFATPPDGSSGTIRMYEWDRSSSELFRIISPDPIAGAFEVSTATFGAVIGAEPISGLVAQAFDASSQPNLVCNAVENVNDINGKVALIDRGTCYFEEKTLNAQNAGAIAVIICNFEDGLINMGGVDEVEDPTIPAVMLRNSDCQQIKVAIAQGTNVEVRLQFVDANNGPDRLDGDLDNSIIAHEFGHGISNRLTGGPGASGCLGNDEQMGEGWSDFFSLVTSVKPGDVGETARGIASYATSSNPNGGGLRRRPYSTDFVVNNQTYRDVVNTGGPGRTDGGPHSLGEVWTSLLWDLYWAFADAYGYDDDLYNGTGGNNMAIQLVMDGMKLQPCGPGFIDGRDAIIGADIILNGGANECLIWEVFARRGFGYSAEQGSNNNRNDGKAAFDINPACIKEMKIAKFMTDFIEPGDETTVILQVRNDKEEAAAGVVVTDEIPAGTSFVMGSATGGATVTSTDQMVTFEIGDMPAGTERVLSYKLSTDPTLRSTRIFFDDVENGFGAFIFDANEGVNIWSPTTDDSYSGNSSWFVPNAVTDNDQLLIMGQPFLVTGSKPALRFFHRYDTETGYDGGIVEISTDGSLWERPSTDKFFRNNTMNVLGYSALAIPFLDGFTGNQNEWIDTYLDLSAYNGQDIQVRFRFGSDGQVGATGWYIDDIEILNVFNYNGEACVSSDQGDQACAIAESRGTIVNSNGIVDAEEVEAQQLNVSIFPNPANDFINVAVSTERIQEVQVSLTSADGKVLSNLTETVGGTNYLIPLDVAKLPAGFYFVRVQTNDKIFTEKVIIE